MLFLSIPGPKLGINVAQPRPCNLTNDRTETYLKCLREIINPSVQLVMTIFPQMKSDRYDAIKKLCLLEKPIGTQVRMELPRDYLLAQLRSLSFYSCFHQVINAKTIMNEKRVVSVAQKVLLQLNCKLGGELWSCATPFKDLMVIGIDVFNDKAKRSGSLVGVVSTINSSLSRYYSTASVQQQVRG